MAPLVQLDLELQVKAALVDLWYNRYPSVQRTTTAHSILIATLAHRYNGAVNKSAGQTSKQLLTTQKETLLVQWLIDLTEKMVPARVNMINSMAGTILAVRDNGSFTQVGSQWYQAFLCRQPGITTKLSRNLNRARATAFTSCLINNWFNLSWTTFERYHITFERIYNMDEIGIAMELINQSMVVALHSSADRYLQQPGNRNWVSILETINGTGSVLSLFLIFKGQSHQ